jgi:hypothetical protein
MVMEREVLNSLRVARDSVEDIHQLVEDAMTTKNEVKRDENIVEARDGRLYSPRT